MSSAPALAPDLAPTAPRAPLTKKAVLRAKVRIVQSQNLINGFVAFGDGPTDQQLVKCGFRLRNKAALIVQGSLTGGKVVTQKLDAGPGETLDVTITVDLEGQKVTFAVKGVTVEAALQRRVESITHVGYCVDNSTADFSPIAVSGQ